MYSGTLKNQMTGIRQYPDGTMLPEWDWTEEYDWMGDDYIVGYVDSHQLELLDATGNI